MQTPAAAQIRFLVWWFTRRPLPQNVSYAEALATLTRLKGRDVITEALTHYSREDFLAGRYDR
jgi:hypothetical protein